MLESGEIARRIRAARELRNLSQDDLGRLLAEDGLGRYDVGRIERGELPMTRVHRDALIRHLGVPERWFTSESVDEIVGVELSDEEIARLLGPRLLEAARALRQGEVPVLRDAGGPDRPPGSVGAADG